jgi:hypothetical protein
MKSIFMRHMTVCLLLSMCCALSPPGAVLCNLSLVVEAPLLRCGAPESMQRGRCGAPESMQRGSHCPNRRAFKTGEPARWRFWRRGRRIYTGDTHLEDMWQLWETTGCCRWWRASMTLLYSLMNELALGWWLACCVSTVPVAGLSVLVWKY